MTHVGLSETRVGRRPRSGGYFFLDTNAPKAAPPHFWVAQQCLQQFAPRCIYRSFWILASAVRIFFGVWLWEQYTCAQPGRAPGVPGSARGGKCPPPTAAPQQIRHGPYPPVDKLSEAFALA